MIEVILELGCEVILVVIRGNDVKFGSTSFGSKLADISGLKLSYKGVCEEFPDLELRDDWREEACLRFKDRINLMESEEEIYSYILTELEKQGYKAKKKKRGGFRSINL